jgi:hypothetical protein
MQKFLEDLLGRPLDNIEQSLIANAVWWLLGLLGTVTLLWLVCFKRMVMNWRDRPNEIWRQAVLLALFDAPSQSGIDLAQIWKSPEHPLQFDTIQFLSPDSNDINRMRIAFKMLLRSGLVKWATAKQEVFVFTDEGLMRARHLAARRDKGLTRQSSEIVTRMRLAGEEVARRKLQSTASKN